MKILLVGASGMIGSRILQEATSRGHTVVATARHPERVPAGEGVEAEALDATRADDLARLATGADAIVLATSPRGGGDPIQEATAVGRAGLEAARQTGRRLFVVGGAGSLTLPDGRFVVETLPEAYRGEALGMKAVLDLLRASDVNWTFFSPSGQIAPGERTGHYRLGTTRLLTDDAGEAHISAEDYAHATLDELETPRHERQQFTAGY